MSLDPVFRGVVTEPPAKANDGDTCVMASPYHPGTYEVLVFGGDIIEGRYREMWFAGRTKLTRAAAVELAKSMAK